MCVVGVKERFLMGLGVKLNERDRSTTDDTWTSSNYRQYDAKLEGQALCLILLQSGSLAGVSAASLCKMSSAWDALRGAASRSLRASKRARGGGREGPQRVGAEVRLRERRT